LRTRSWFPPFAECAKDGASHRIFSVSQIRGWATRPKDLVENGELIRDMLREAVEEDEEQ
jgi:hypothetical protein